MNFREVPIVTFCEREFDDDDEVSVEAHYEVKIEKIMIGDIKVERDPYWDIYTTSLKGGEKTAALELIRPMNSFTGVKTIYFDDSCTVPRFKLGEMCGKYGLKVTRSPDKADALIYGNEFADSILDHRSSEEFNFKDDFIKQAKALKGKKKLNLIEDILPVIEKCNSDIVLIDDFDRDTYDNCPLSVQPKSKKDNVPEIDLHYLVLNDDVKYSLVTGKNNLIHQDMILEQLSTVVIDEKMYESLCTMFQSKNQEDHLVAMEIMSNSAYRKNIVYLLDLMRQYYGPVIHNINEKRNVSFRALREYLQYEPIGEKQRSFNDAIDVIVNKNALTEANYKLLLSLILKEENSEMEEDKDNWRVAQVDLSPEIKAKIIWDKKKEPELEQV